MTGREFRALLEELEVRPGELVYVHSSYSRLRHFGTAEELLNALLDLLGPSGTAVFPSFTWNVDPAGRPWSGYAVYYRTRPTFDVRNSPCNIGWLAECFRHLRGVRRSVSYFWSVTAHGPLAEIVTRGQAEVVHPFGPGSSFAELREARAKIVGLGVTLNTSSLAPLVDYALGEQHPHVVFSSKPKPGPVVDVTGKSRLTWSYFLLPEVVRLIKPSGVFEAAPKARTAVRRADRGETIFFAYPYPTFHEVAVELGQRAITENSAVPWLRNYATRFLQPVRA